MGKTSGNIILYDYGKLKTRINIEHIFYHEINHILSSINVPSLRHYNVTPLYNHCTLLPLFA